MTEDRYTPYEQAMKLYYMGWCIIYIPYGKKAARIKWKKFQDRRSNYTNLRNWFCNTLRQNLAVVLGKVSHGLACRDFDSRTGYQAWTDQHPNLSKTLPTVRTPHGYHVYFQGKVKGVKYLKNREGQPVGELRGGGYYCILPPSVGEGGQRYEWVNPLTRENLLWFEPEQIESIFCNTGNSHVTERTERTNENRRGKGRGEKLFANKKRLEKAWEAYNAINLGLLIVDCTLYLRIFEYKNSEGHNIFAYPFRRCEYSDKWWLYIINAVDIERDPKKVKWFCIPSEVFLDIVKIMLSEEWVHAMEPAGGCVFTIIRRRPPYSSYEYLIKLTGRVYSVGKAVLRQVVDPATIFGPPGAFVYSDALKYLIETRI